MTTKQKLTIRDIEIRARLNEIAGMDGELSDEVRAEDTALQTEYRDVSVKLAAAVAAEPDPETRVTAPVDAEERERRELRAKVSLSDFIGAAVAHGDAGQVTGEAREYAAAEGCAGMVPITMFGDTTEQRAARHAAGVEHRNVTPGPADADVPSMFAPIVPAVFDRSVAEFLGVEMPTVGTGIASYPVLGTSLTGGMVSEDTAAVQTAGGFTVADADPRRLSGSFLIRKEDIAKLPNLEPALRENLSMVLSDELDKQLVNGNGTSPNLNGILQQLTDPTAPAAGAETFARYQTALSSHVDGLWATAPTDVRLLAGPDTVRHMLGTYRANEDATTAYQLAMAQYGGVRATRRIADPASNIQQAIIRRANPAGDRVAVAPVWMGMEVLRDPWTKAREGQVQVTGTVLIGGVVLLRSGAFVQDSFRVA